MPDIEIIPFLASKLRLPEADRAALGVEWWPSYGHAVAHPGGVFLFDNGAGTGNAEIEATFSPRIRPLDEALRSAGISIADVTGAANCHLHFDHAGQNAQLMGVPIFVQRTEWAMVHQPDYTVAEWIDVPGLTYEVLDGESDVGPGLRLIPTPGHTAGHQSLVIDVPDGPIVLAGQSVRSLAEWEGSTSSRDTGRPEGSAGEVYDESVARMRALAPSRVHFAHDVSIWER